MKGKKSTSVRYSSEFKAEAVAKCMEIGVSRVSEELGVAPSTLRKWKKSLESNASSQSSGTEKPSYEELERENRRLKKELGYVSEINEILKKSTAIFSSDQMGGLR